MVWQQELETKVDGGVVSLSVLADSCELLAGTQEGSVYRLLLADLTASKVRGRWSTSEQQDRRLCKPFTRNTLALANYLTEINQGLAPTWAREESVGLKKSRDKTPEIARAALQALQEEGCRRHEYVKNVSMQF